ncbi:Translation initiation factor 3 subunit J [Klebsormidium nitens]|uniref:Eukaryotic translation initiation factor 3 subunit J n=1 Tax=Klebsormidium nitens TaxID=105231 RepID=A0A1Y1HMN2_KLENI|nr:Translation initiation factor 3 subunit J [Klebsormidium nitens]|eukprot:GAQ79880.1 Translation initiation factor 3 subunit J [Klebsormidium nitens]
MADSWEDDDFEPAAPVAPQPPVKGAWDDEEEEEEEVKETSADKPAAAAKPKKDKKPKAAPKDETLADPVAEKLRQQRLVEESDFKATKELFGGDKEERSLEGFIPKTEADYLEYATLVAEKVTPFQKSFHYLTMLKQLSRVASEPLKGADVKDLASALTVLANEKLKAEKAAEKGGTKAKAKAKRELKVDAADNDYGAAGTYDDPDGYDFM